jgi:nucleoid-associated protein YgaU
MQPVPSNATFAQYAWFMLSGTGYVNATAAVAVAAPLYISATAGKAFTTLTAGRQLVNMCPVVAATGTIAKTAIVQSGSPIIKVGNTDGWFVGGSVSGTGIATSLITNIDQAGNVTLASNATASGTVTATQTANDGTNFFPIVQMNNPFAQGNIT